MFRDVLKLFVPAFLLFFAVGAVAGWGDRKETASRKLYENLEIVKKDEAYLLALRCRGVVFDTETDRSRIEGDLLGKAAFHETALGRPSQRHMEIVGIVSSLIGGTTGGYQLKDILSRTPTKPGSFWSWSQIKKTVWGLVGGISGYSAGNWIASTYDTDCDSEIAVEVLREPATWRNFELKFLLASIKELETTEGAKIFGTKMINQTPWKADPVYSCRTAVVAWTEALGGFLSQTDINPGAEDFRKLDRIKTAHKRAKISSEYKWLSVMRIYRSEAKGKGRIPDATVAASGYSDDRWEKACTRLNAVILGAVE